MRLWNRLFALALACALSAAAVYAVETNNLAEPETEAKKDDAPAAKETKIEDITLKIPASWKSEPPAKGPPAVYS